MADERDFRVRMDITLPKAAAAYADEIKDALQPFMQYGVVIHEGTDHEERGFIDVERCGHRLDLLCERLARWEVGLGQTYP